MKKPCLILILTALFFQGFPQEKVSPDDEKESRNISLDFIAGYSIALGDYSGYAKDNPGSGYASNGFYAQLSCNWVGKRNIGLGVSYMYQRNGLLDTAKEVTPYKGLTLGDKPWSNHYLLAGPVYSQYFKKVLVEVKVLGGFLLSSSSNFYMPEPITETDTTTRIAKGMGTGFGYQLTAGIGYTITNRISIKLNLQYAGGAPKRNKTFSSMVKEEIEDPVTGEISIREYYTQTEFTIKKRVSAINVGIGIQVKL